MIYQFNYLKKIKYCEINFDFVNCNFMITLIERLKEKFCNILIFLSYSFSKSY